MIPGFESLTIEEIPYDFCFSNTTGPETLFIPVNRITRLVELDRQTERLPLNRITREIDLNRETEILPLNRKTYEN